ncbi:MAG: lysylphosphatidylglycerol synthase domain-containing protein [Bacteroidota bacterium]
MDQDTSQHFDIEQEKVLDSIRPGRIILPTLIGLGVIIYLIYRQVNFEEILTIDWRPSSYLWMIVAILVYAGRHMLYSYRLRALSEGEFSWPKSVELVTILEFASSVSPTNFGGSAVAFFLLIQERISAKKTPLRTEHAVDSCRACVCLHTPG